MGKGRKGLGEEQVRWGGGGAEGEREKAGRGTRSEKWREDIGEIKGGRILREGLTLSQLTSRSAALLEGAHTRTLLPLSSS